MSKKLTDYERLELIKLTQDERTKCFKDAIEEMAEKGIISPEYAKEWLTNIDKWLLEELEN